MSSNSAEQFRLAVVGLVDVCNTFSEAGPITAAVRQAVAESHRTLQQALFRMFVVPVLQQLAEQFITRRYDSRNEAACRYAAQMMAAVEDDPYLPFI